MMSKSSRGSTTLLIQHLRCKHAHEYKVFQAMKGKKIMISLLHKSFLKLVSYHQEEVRKYPLIFILFKNLNLVEYYIPHYIIFVRVFNAYFVRQG